MKIVYLLVLVFVVGLVVAEAIPDRDLSAGTRRWVKSALEQPTINEVHASDQSGFVSTAALGSRGKMIYP